MLYLIDANVLITAQRDYYARDQVPEFWDWLLYQAEQGFVKIPLEILREITNGRKENNPLLDWVSNHDNKKVLTLEEEVHPERVQKVMDEGYAAELTDDELEYMGRDPILIAYAAIDPQNRCIVTTEVSSPHKIRHKRKIPDVCNTFSINCIHTYKFTRELKFSTTWRK